MDKKWIQYLILIKCQKLLYEYHENVGKAGCLLVDQEFLNVDDSSHEELTKKIDNVLSIAASKRNAIFKLVKLSKKYN